MEKIVFKALEQKLYIFPLIYFSMVSQSMLEELETLTLHYDHQKEMLLFIKKDNTLFQSCIGKERVVEFDMKDEYKGTFHTHPKGSIFNFSWGDFKDFIQDPQELIMVCGFEGLIFYIEKRYFTKQIKEFIELWRVTKGKDKSKIRKTLFNLLKARVKVFRE